MRGGWRGEACHELCGSVSPCTRRNLAPILRVFAARLARDPIRLRCRTSSSLGTARRVPRRLRRLLGAALGTAAPAPPQKRLLMCGQPRCCLAPLLLQAVTAAEPDDSCIMWRCTSQLARPLREQEQMPATPPKETRKLSEAPTGQILTI